jgi:hypothetical protein
LNGLMTATMSFMIARPRKAKKSWIPRYAGEVAHASAHLQPG